MDTVAPQTWKKTIQSPPRGHQARTSRYFSVYPSPPPPKKRKNGSQKYRKKPFEVHLEVTRLERHAIFRRSISLDDVDCFEALKSHTYQSHEFITLLFIELRGPFRVVLMRASCQSRFLCDVIERNRTPTLSYCHLAAFTVPHKAVSGPSCGPAGSGT